MTLPIPLLDDLEWSELVSEARDRLPSGAPDWTDHNIHDPGITILELFGWLTEQTSFRLDQIDAAHREQFASLLGRQLVDFGSMDLLMNDAARALQAHDSLVKLAERHDALSLDEVPFELIAPTEVPDRAATLLDLERVAFATPETDLRRVRAWAEIDLAQPCARAVGTVSIVVLPNTSDRRPSPTSDELAAVRGQVGVRKTLGTRVRVHAPSYTEVAVHVSIDVADGADSERVIQRVEGAVREFLDPLRGGPLGRGWPFGRDVYRTEFMALVGAVDGVELARTVRLALAGSVPEACSNLCVPAVDLVALEELTVEVAQ